MTEIVITSVEQLRAHSAAVVVPGWDDPDPVWTCPECGEVNVGARFHCETKCAECGKFFYPRKGCKVEDKCLKEIVKLEAEYDEIVGEIEHLEGRRDEIEERLKKLRCED